MPTTNSSKLKEITFTLGGNDFKCQLETWQMVNNTEDGERFYTFCGPGSEGEFREEAEPDYALELTFHADWRLNGISDYLTTNDQQTVAFVLVNRPNTAGQAVQWSGSLKVKAPTAGGQARTTEKSDITLPVIGKPTYTRL